MYRITNDDGQYYCEVQIQDGTENYITDDLARAKNWVKTTAKVMNRDEAPEILYRETTSVAVRSHTEWRYI